MPDHDPPVSHRDPLGRWPKGVSGNPKGRPQGSAWVDRMRTVLRESAAEPLLEAMLRAGVAGDVRAAEVILDRCLPTMRQGIDEVTLRVRGSTLADQARAVATAMMSGTLSPTAGSELLCALRTAVEITDAVELVQRLEALESRLRAPPMA